jgi:hypothetical protein
MWGLAVGPPKGPLTWAEPLDGVATLQGREASEQTPRQCHAWWRRRQPCGHDAVVA